MAQRPDDEDNERETTLYHGTTLDVAEHILARKQFEARETYFAATRDLACLFAIRSSRKRANAQRAGHELDHCRQFARIACA
ncbi:hypothetical protein A8M77_19510 [Variovorax sp. JS1663]|nr:hypothetical protein A8M77_19510 [Variovorax sp. JS1663]